MIARSQPAPPRRQPQDLRPLSLSNANLERDGVLANPGQLWVDWVWKADPEEPFEPAILMNRSHLLGLLACRHMAGVMQSSQQPRQKPAPDCGDDRMTLLSKSPSDYTLRELRDTVDNLLIEWPQFVCRLGSNPRAADNLAAVAELVDGCFARLGHLAQRPAGANLFDDAASTEPHGPESMRLSRPGLRRLLGSFMALYRHLDLLRRAERAPDRPDAQCEIRKHHVEASNDDFHMLCMNLLLPAAAKLNYKQDFPGMYNHVSQVTYFHNPQYERTPRAELEEILRTGEPAQALPAISQIHPEIELAYEEDAVDLSGPTGKWRWLVLPRRVYLVGPDSRVYHHDNVFHLLAVYKDAVANQERARRPGP
jgi:hypothetical protein